MKYQQLYMAVKRLLEDEGITRLEEDRQPKVDSFQWRCFLLISKQEIFRLKITMHDTVLMTILWKKPIWLIHSLQKQNTDAT